MPERSTIFLATRGSALALAQADRVLSQCRAAFPHLQFDIKVIRTTGDKMETAALARAGSTLDKGLFTKELEVALLEGHADLAVHSLKDLPTELPNGLKLGAVTRRADARDVLICRGPGPARFSPETLRQGAVIGTSSTRRQAQLLALRPDLNIVELRGNIISRLQRLGCRPELDAIVLAAAGLERLDFEIDSDGRLMCMAVNASLRAVRLDLDKMLPCVGQGALGIEVRENDERAAEICKRLNHADTAQCVTAERAFLAAMGGGCASPVAAYAELIGEEIQMRAISFPDGTIRRTAGWRPSDRAADLGCQLAAALKKANAGGPKPVATGVGAADYDPRETPARI